MEVPVFYRDKPLFGFDIGHDSVKVMQIADYARRDTVMGYGHANFDPKAIKNGVVVDPELIAKEAYRLISKGLIGAIDTKRIAASIPVSNTFNRILTLPQMDKNDLTQAVQLEAEQYIPMPLEQLYLDYEIARRSDDGSSEVLMVAVPKSIVDSYITLFDMLGLEVALLETTISAVSRIVRHSDRTGIPTLIIDFGSVSSDLAVFDRTIRVTGTADWGGETITKDLSKDMKITDKQAYTIKTRYGLNPGKKQAEIIKALEPMLKKLMNEIKKMTRFYEERASEKSHIEQIIVLGGGANLPGLSTYLTDQLRIPTRLINPWQNLSFGNLQPPHKLETTLYTTAAGLSLAKMRGANND